MYESPIGSSAHSTNPSDSSGPSQTPNGSPLPSSSPDHPSENVDVADEFCSDQVGEDNSPEAKLRSKYWAHYKRVKINGEWKACCKYCPAKISGRTENGTSHLQQHYNRKHLKKESMRQQVLTNNFMNRDRPMEITSYSFDQGTARKELANAIIMHEYPLSIVEHVGFRRYSKSLQPLFKVPCRNTIKSEIFKIYEYQRGKTMSLVVQNSSRLAITTDMRTSSNQKKGFMAVTAHFIDDSWTLQSRILRYKLNVLEFYFSKLFPESFIEEVEKVRALCYKLLKEYRNPSSMVEGIGESSSPSTHIDVESLTQYDVYMLQSKRRKTIDTAKLELDHYLAEDPLPKTPGFDVLNWWKSNEGKYPILQGMARDMLAIPVSSVASESAFSASGRLVSPHRSRLHPDTMEALMCAQSWLWALEMKGEASSGYATIYDDSESGESCVTRQVI